jgi:hypothetical protein
MSALISSGKVIELVVEAGEVERGSSLFWGLLVSFRVDLFFGLVDFLILLMVGVEALVERVRVLDIFGRDVSFGAGDVDGIVEVWDV